MNTNSEKYCPAMEIIDQDAADVYFEKLVKHAIQCRRAKQEPAGRSDAEAIERHNLGYYAGYYSHETRERVERLFKCSHPIFGSIARNGAPTPTEAMAAGMVAAKSGIKMAAKLFKHAAPVDSHENQGSKRDD